MKIVLSVLYFELFVNNFVFKRENKREKENVLSNKTNDFQKHKKEIA